MGKDSDNSSAVDFKDDHDNQLPYEPTAVLAKAHPNQPINRSLF
ncbi:MAG: hypothetical protein WBE34_15240 [Candidatus Nitrosopolaris sp.]